MSSREDLLLKVAKRWISGVEASDALSDARVANLKGMDVVINFLGEEITDQSVAEAHLQEYLKLQQAMSAGGIRGHVSVKLTQFGLGSDDLRARERLEKVTAEASRLGQLLWIDMEGSDFHDRTLDLYLEARGMHSNVGVALQSYMRRSASDLDRLIKHGSRVRLVKGAYRESRQVVFSSRAETTENYSKLMRVLFDRGENFVIATHDSLLIDEAKRLSDSKHVDFEFQMLKGIRDGLKEELLRSGYRVGVYLPYGDQWYAYSKRRIREHPSNILLLLRSLI